jgi:hypothetical protein
MIEATQDAAAGFNHGKFMLGRFDEEEWAQVSRIDTRMLGFRPPPLLSGSCGWTPDHLLVMDLQTGEGAIFRPGGMAVADLEKHRVWVCPMFEPFLEWLYRQDLGDLDGLPYLVELPDAPAAMAGYRRPGPPDVQGPAVVGKSWGQIIDKAERELAEREYVDDGPEGACPEDPDGQHFVGCGC